MEKQVFLQNALLLFSRYAILLQFFTSIGETKQKELYTQQCLEVIFSINGHS